MTAPLALALDPVRIERLREGVAHIITEERARLATALIAATRPPGPRLSELARLRGLSEEQIEAEVAQWCDQYDALRSRLHDVSESYRIGSASLADLRFAHRAVAAHVASRFDLDQEVARRQVYGGGS